jgi:glycosyltransferase involved in cell wall biosynthesis
LSDDKVLRDLRHRVESGLQNDQRNAQLLHRIESSSLSSFGLGELYWESKVEDGITIFIPNWNHNPHLPRSIHSALCAVEYLERVGYSGEVLVVDDASRDGSQKLLRTIQMLYGEHRLKTLFLEQNLGLPRLRNLALQMSRFQYVCMMDADNELLPDNLPLFFKSIVETKAALVYGNLIYKWGRKTIHMISEDVATLRLSKGNYIDAFALVDARKLLSVGGYTSDPRIYAYEDWEMVLHLIAEEEKLVFVPAVMGHYHRQSGSMLQEASAIREETYALVRRMFTQGGTREWDPVRVGHIYHPDVGYINEQ